MENNIKKLFIKISNQFIKQVKEIITYIFGFNKYEKTLRNALLINIKR